MVGRPPLAAKSSTWASMHQQPRRTDVRTGGARSLLLPIPAHACRSYQSQHRTHATALCSPRHQRRTDSSARPVSPTMMLIRLSATFNATAPSSLRSGPLRAQRADATRCSRRGGRASPPIKGITIHPLQHCAVWSRAIVSRYREKI